AVAQRSAHQSQKHLVGRRHSRTDDPAMAGNLTREPYVAAGSDDDGSDSVDPSRDGRRCPAEPQTRRHRHSSRAEWTLTTRRAAALLANKERGAAASRT